ncbi:hypothetical protein WA026_000751 [Henosepilachna vigintioctopunctata]|uniref:Uncharacterized protein n=1 Tax=Henosepilachna vigintioctopunctata TaxID=420089 RepID=A0AAW1V657_9CUCU
MKIVLGILLMCFSWTLGHSEKENTVLDTAEFILPCQISDPDIDECIIKGLNHLRPYLKKGIEEIQLPSMEPLEIGELVIDNSQGLFILKATFFNVVVNGPTEYSIKSLKSDVSTLTADIRIGIPKLDIRGSYNMKGNILRIPVTSHGTFSCIFYDIDVVAKVRAGVLTNDKGIKFLQIAELTIDFRLKKSEFEIQDLLLQKTAIGANLVQLLNRFSEEIMEATRPTTSSVLAHHFKEILNPVLLHLPLKLFLPDA